MSPTVQLVGYMRGDSRRLYLAGLESCKSPFCPGCSAKWARVRTDEITRAIEYWGQQRVVFVTETMPHHRGMRLALMSRLLRAGHGHLWSGRKGQEAAALLGGKPETIRAQDRTASYERGWHPHLHSLFFLQSLATSDADLLDVLNDRWPAALRTSLRSLKALCARLLSGTARCRDRSCAVCLRIEHGECANLRERATRLFGTRLVPRKLPLLESVRKISQGLDSFSEPWMFPTEGARGEAWQRYRVHAQRVRSADEVAEYLTKMVPQKLGLELAGVAKLGKVSSDGVRHYGLWELAELAVRPVGPDHPAKLRNWARRAWKELYWASTGMQQVTFSSREKLGLGPDPYADGAEPDEQSEHETSVGLGEIIGQVWDQEVRDREHLLVAELEVAFERNVLGSVPYVSTLPLPIHGTPRERDPPATGPPPEERARRRAERLLEAERRGARVVGGALRKLDAESADESLWIEELRYRLKTILGT